jgi:hypothetical protein
LMECCNAGAPGGIVCGKRHEHANPPYPVWLAAPAPQAAKRRPRRQAPR